ncbi:DUF3253 domain-containing protein [Lysobacter sp. TY2-98]|uniref:DUF3253 domain-containing protein n=1 Tax=Lysobacter sp. TY2-98 TaxID=2290922 RepID=UPI000E1FD16A|nr:DUF3253 domain-containing protein [Lysobacter sp. TY2-98]AXK72469.1 DUF3253 domain-containing protein [Lysobacter sp. TY2-98]
MTGDATIRESIVALLSARSPDASVCPSEVARSLEATEDAWRTLMPQVRQVAAAMAEARLIVATQGERVVPSAEVLMASGPIRLRRGPAFPVDA